MGGNGAPVFLVGTGRCGSTIVDSVLAMHPDFAWIPSWVDSFPRLPVLALANRIWNLPGLDGRREARFFPTPVEPNETFRHHVASFDRESLADDVVEEHRKQLIPLIDTVRRLHGKPRFLAKLVGRPVKVDLFDLLYPDAFFVHVTRDLEPTLNSLLRVDFFKPEWTALERWPWDEVPPEYLELYRESNCSAELGAAILLKLNRRVLDSQLAAVDASRRLEIAYADFVADPVATVRHIGALAGFAVDDRFEQRIRGRQIYAGADDKWRKLLSPETVGLLDRLNAISG